MNTGLVPLRQHSCYAVSPREEDRILEEAIPSGLLSGHQEARLAVSV